VRCDDSLCSSAGRVVSAVAPARTKFKLAKVAARQLRSVQRRPERIKSCFEHGPVRYAA
jgi:hypothetical protein